MAPGGVASQPLPPFFSEDAIPTTLISKPLDGIWQPEERERKVVFCTPCLARPTRPYLDSLAASVPLFEAAGIEEASVWHVGCPYISAARSLMLRKALDAGATDIVFIDYDLSWRPEDLLRLVQTEGDVVAGTYRFKKEPEEYMGRLIPNDGGTPIVREDGCIKAFCVPAGFLKVTRKAVNHFIEKYPNLLYGEKCAPHVDLFNHGAHDGVWYGEDYAFSRNWLDAGGEIWLIPDLDLDHWSGDIKYAGNFHRFLLRQPGGSEDPARLALVANG